MTTIATLMSELENRRQQRAEAFWRIARQLADDKPTDPEEVERALAACGKSFEELEQAARLIATRQKLAARVSAAAGLDDEQVAIEAKIAAENERVKAAAKRRDETVFPLEMRLREIRELREAAKGARAELVRSCPYPDRIAQLAALREKLTAAHASVRDLILKKASENDVVAQRAAESLPAAQANAASLQREEKELEEALTLP